MPPTRSSDDVAVMIIDDHEVVRRGIAEVVDRSEGMAVVAEAGSVAEAVRRAAVVRPQIMLVDLQLPDGTGIDVLRTVRESLPETRAVVLTSFDDDDALAAALEVGAAAYLLKTVHGAEIAEVIRSVAAGRTLLDERTVTRRRAAHDDPAAELTPSERRVVDLIGDGMSNREIAERLGVSEKTVKSHVSNILGKLHLEDRTQAAVFAWREGLKQR
jgi:two-component system, NarL family, response regulator DevR